MSKDNLIELETQDSFEDALTDALRSGARRLLAGAVETEVEQSWKRGIAWAQVSWAGYWAEVIDRRWLARILESVAEDISRIA